MVRRLLPGLARHCRGLAMVLPAGTIQENAKVIKAGPKIWGCPVHATQDLETARVWAHGQ